MKSKKLIILLSCLSAVLVLAISFILLISPKGRLPYAKPSDFKTIEEFKAKKADEAFKGITDKAQRVIEIQVGNKEIENLVAVELEEIRKKNGDFKVNGYRTRVTDGYVELQYDGYFMKFLPARFTIQMEPSIENNAITFFVKKVKMGSITVPRGYVLKRLKMQENGEYMVDLEKNKVILDNQLAEQFVFKKIELKDGTVRATVAVSISSLRDLVSVLGSILPEDLKPLLDKIDLNEFKAMASNIVKEVALSQISGMAKTLKNEAVTQINGFIKSPEKMKSIKDKVVKATADTLKKKAEDVVKKIEKENNIKLPDITDTKGIVDSLKDTLVDGVKDKIEEKGITEKLDILKGLLE